MKKSILGVLLAFTMLLMFSVAGVQAAFVTIEDFSDSTPGIYFLEPVEVLEAGDVTSFTIRLGAAGFTATASSPDGSPVVSTAHDNISFNIKAAEGRWITGVEYTETGSGTASPGSASIAQGGIAVNLKSLSFPMAMYTAPSTIPWTFGPATFDFSGMHLTEVPMTIDNSLTAVALGLDSSATISKDPASLIITTTAIPVPSAIVLLLSGLVAIIGIRKRSQGAE